MRDKVEVSELFASFFTGDRVSRDDVKDAYRKAALELHPDFEDGDAEKFVKVKDEKEDLLEQEMREGAVYELSVAEQSDLNGGEHSERGAWSNDFYRELGGHWSQGLLRTDSDYRLETCRDLGGSVIGRFEDGSDLYFSIKAELEGDLFSHETKYFHGGEVVQSYERSVYSFEIFDTEEYFQGISETAAEGAEHLKQGDEEFFYFI